MLQERNPKLLIVNGLQGNLSFALEEAINRLYHHLYIPRLTIQTYLKKQSGKKAVSLLIRCAET